LEMPRAERPSPAANRSPPSSDQRRGPQRAAQGWQRERPSEKWRATSTAALAQALMARGHRVRCCERPHQALRLSRLQAFDLLWMEWPLTGMEGLEFMRRLRHVRPLMPVAIACRQEPEAPLRLQLKARGVTLLLRADVPLPLAAAAAEACIASVVP